MEVSTILIYFFFITVFVTLNHMGRDIHIPYFYNARFHQLHHLRRDCNFCEHTHLWDVLFDTYYMPDNKQPL